MYAFGLNPVVPGSINYLSIGAEIDLEPNVFTLDIDVQSVDVDVLDDDVEES